MALFDNKKSEPKVVYVTKEKIVTKEVEKPVYIEKEKDNSLLTSTNGSINLGFKKDNKEAKTYNINSLESLEKYLEEEDV